MDQMKINPQGFAKLLVFLFGLTVGVMALPYALRLVSHFLHLFDKPPELPMDAEFFRLALWGIFGALLIGILIRLARKT